MILLANYNLNLVSSSSQKQFAYLNSILYKTSTTINAL